MQSTITEAEAAKITAWLETHELPSGLGTEEAACSIAAINLAMTGRLTDDIPSCMSRVIGRWIICTQDAMPYDMRNSAEWKRLLPLAAGTGRALEKQRAAIALDWMWSVVLPQLQPLADKRGYGDAWRRMTTEKTREAALEAKKAAAAYAAAATDAAAAAAAYVAAAAATPAAVAADAAAYAAAAVAAAAATAVAADAAADADAAAKKKFWEAVDPCACLAKMIAVDA